MLTVVTIVATLSFNYRLLPALLPIVLVLGWLTWWYRRHDLPPRAPIGRLGLLCLVPTAAIVGTYMLLVGAAAVGLPHLPALLSRQFIRSGAESALPFAFPDFYVRTLWEFGGPTLLLAGGGLVACLWSWRRLDPLAAIAIGSMVGTLLFFSAAHDKAPRAIVACVPFAALVIARGVTLLRSPALQWTVALTLCGTCLVTGWTESSFARDASGSDADWKTQIAAFKFPSCTPVPKGFVAGIVTDSDATPLSGALVQADNGMSTLTDGSGHYSLTLSPGSIPGTGS